MTKSTRSVLEVLARFNPVLPGELVDRCADEHEMENVLSSILQSVTEEDGYGIVEEECRDLLLRTHATKVRRRVIVGVAAVLVAAVGALAFVLPSSPAHPTSAAAAVLSKLANVAAVQPPTMLAPGQYLYSEVQQLTLASMNANPTGTATNAGPNVLYWTSGTTVQTWVNSAGTGRMQVVNNQNGTWLTPGGAAYWRNVQSSDRAAGKCVSPDSDPCAHPTPVQTLGLDRPFTVGPDPFVYPNSLKLDLPTDPTALRQALIAADSSYLASIGEPVPQTFSTFTFFNLAQEGLQVGLSPAVRSAIFQMLASLPGVVSLGSVIDDQGIAGVGIAASTGGIQQQLIFDPSSSALLEVREVQVSPNVEHSGNTGSLSNSSTAAAPSVSNPPVGSVIGSTSYLLSGIASSTSVTPGGTTVPVTNSPAGS